MSDQCLVSVDQAARQLGMAKSSLYRMAVLNLIPSYKVGQKKRGVRLSIPEVLAALRRPPADELARRGVTK